MPKRIRPAASRFPQSDQESQNPASSRGGREPSVLPRDYPKVARTKLPRYDPWPNSMPRDYQRPNNSPAPFQRLRAADLRVVKRLENRKGVAGSIKPKPFVLSNFDARPINAIDFVDTFSAAELATLPADTFTTTFNVPTGRVAIVRRLQLKVYMSAAGARDAVTGAPAETITASFSINGIVVEQASSIRVDEAICTLAYQQGGMDIPLYFLVPEGSALTLTLTNTAGGLTFTFVSPTISGNLLLSEGGDVASEPGTQRPLLTRAL